MDLETALTASDLLTVAGAGFVAWLAAQFAKVVLNVSNRVVRLVAGLGGLIVIGIATFASGQEANVLSVLLVLVGGMQAGLSAVALHDIASSGMDFHAIEG